MNKLLQKLPAIVIAIVLLCLFGIPLVVSLYSGGGLVWVFVILGSLILLQFPLFYLFKKFIPTDNTDDEESSSNL